MSGTIRSDRRCPKISFLVDRIFVVRIHAAELGRVICIKDCGLLAERDLKALRADRGLRSEGDFLQYDQSHSMSRTFRQADHSVDGHKWPQACCTLLATAHLLFESVHAA